MKKRIVFLSACFVLFASVLAWAADVKGKWTAQVPGRGGQTSENTFTFNVEGDKLTGTVANQRGENPISDGKISGDDISFTMKISAGGNDITFLYKGKVSGDEIKFTRSVQGGGGDRPPQEFTAKRAK